MLDQLLMSRAAAATAARQAATAARDSCSICYLEFYGQSVRMTSTICGHVFCSRCIQRALAVRSMCPVCRRPLSVYDVHEIYL